MSRLKVKIWKEPNGEWRADPVDLPGSPPNGRGKNKWEALGSLLFAIRHEREWERCGWPKIELVNGEGEQFPVHGTEEE